MLLNRIELKSGLKELGASVEKIDQSLMGSYVFCEVTSIGVSLATCDGSFYTEIPLIADNSISFDVNFKELKKFVDAAKGDTIEVTIIEDVVKFISGDSSIVLSQYSVNNEDMTHYEHNIINGENYHHDIIINDAVYAAVDTTNPKFELNGLMVDFRSGFIASTDTRRLSLSKIEVVDLDSIIIPKQALKKGAIMSDIYFDSMNLHYTLDGIKKRSKLIQGAYPEYKRIVPITNKINIAINGLEFKDKLKGMGDCNFEFLNNVLTIKSHENNTKISLPCDFPCSTHFAMDINSKYILESIEDNKMELCINSSHLPITLKNLDSGNNTVIMPFVMDKGDKHDYDTILDELKISIVEFSYSEITKKKIKRVNKDAIIKKLELEIRELKNKLSDYENDKNIVKNKIFRDTLNKCKKVS